MFADDLSFQKDLLDHKIYSAWQFIIYTRKNIETVEYCYNIINNIIEKLTLKTVRWQQNLFNEFAEDVIVDGKTGKRVSVTTKNQPIYDLRVAGEKVNPWFLFDKLLRDFYQYSMNALDSVSQIANAGLLANRGKKVDVVDFQRISDTFMQQTYQTAFPKTSQWFQNTYNSSEFKYLEAINNRTKHTSDIANKLSMGILGSGNITEIGPFFRKGSQHNKKDLLNQLQASLDFLNQVWKDFLDVFCLEYPFDNFIENRTHSISGVYQCKFKEDVAHSCSYAYITNSSFDNMPDELYVLFAYDKDEIDARVCPFDTIIIRKDEHTILGRYKAEEPVGEDCLLFYRKYVKDNSNGTLCLFFEQKGKETKFYHANPFFNLTTVSDDDEFIKRTQLPF